jgi:hypothetical protein
MSGRPRNLKRGCALWAAACNVGGFLRRIKVDLTRVYLASPRRNLGATRWHLVTALLSWPSRRLSGFRTSLLSACLALLCLLGKNSIASLPSHSELASTAPSLNPRPTSNTLTTESNPPVAISPPLLSSHAHLFRLANKLPPFPLLELALSIGTSVSKSGRKLPIRLPL